MEGEVRSKPCDDSHESTDCIHRHPSANIPAYLSKSLKQPERILIRGVNWLGDAIMTTPALMAVRKKFPDAKISLATRENLAELWTEHPAINEVIRIDRKQSPLRIGREWRGERFDLAIILPNSLRSAMECMLARIPVRLGYKGAGRSWMLTQRIPKRRDVFHMKVLSDREVERAIASQGAKPEIPAHSHHVAHYLHLVSQIGAPGEWTAPILHVSDHDVTATAQRFGMAVKPDCPVIGINPGAQYGPAKRWPIENFVSTVTRLHEKARCQFVLFGGPADEEITDEISVALRSEHGEGSISFFNASGRTSLRELATLLKHCDVLISNDTGPTHLAAAVGTAVVVPFGSTSPELTGPGLPGGNDHAFLKSETPCSPCFRRDCPIDFRCMDDITVDRVVTAVCEAIAVSG